MLFDRSDEITAVVQWISKDGAGRTLVRSSKMELVTRFSGTALA
jgi:hypothetical protein